MRLNRIVTSNTRQPGYLIYQEGPASQLLVATLVLYFITAVLPSRAQNGNGNSQVNGPSATPTAVTAPVKVEGRKLFEVLGSSGGTASDRASQISRRLAALIERQQPVLAFNEQDIVERGGQSAILLGNEAIMNVTDADAVEALTTRQELARLWGGKLSIAVIDARSARANALKGVGIVIRNSVSDLFVSLMKWLPRMAAALILWILIALLSRVVRWIAKFVTGRLHFDANLRQLARASAYYGTWVIGIIAILSTLGLDSASIAAGLGISGFVLGFAFKDILSHFFAGLMLLIGRQFHIGDQIIVSNYEGTVERIELRALYLRTYDNRLVIIPNGDVFTSAVTSNTASPHRRRDFLVGIGYEVKIEEAQQIALETVLQTPGVLHEPAPDVLVDELAASTVNLRIRFYMNSTRADYLKVGSEAMRCVKDAFDHEGISMPTDIQTIVIANPEVIGDVANRQKLPASTMET